MALRLCLGATTRLSILQIPHFAPSLLQPHLRVVAHGCRSKMTAREINAHVDDKFIMIYKFPYIVHATTLCRVKLYQTGLTTLMVPALVFMNSSGLATVEQCKSACAVSLFACAVLYAVSIFFRRLIGIMYVNESKDILKIAHLTFMGARRDTLVPVQDVIPLADLCLSARSVYYPLKLYSKKEFYYYILRYGGVIKPELFKLVLGEEALARTPQKLRES